jgi:hypothetical protein
MAFDAAAVFRAGLALIAGILTGTVLAVLCVDGPADAITHTAQLLTSLFNGPSAPVPGAAVPMGRTIIVAEWRVALIYSTIVGVVAAPIWYGMGRMGLNRLWQGVVLGLILGALAGGLVFYKSSDGVSAALLKEAAIFSVVGAVSGAVTWFVGHRRRARLA